MPVCIASHPLRVRGLKPLTYPKPFPLLLSHPLRVRGLKLCSYCVGWYHNLSHPLRVRGLKRVINGKRVAFRGVAPPAGAWIETPHQAVGLEDISVAPPAGAWIETEDINCRCTVRAGRTPCGCVD